MDIKNILITVLLVNMTVKIQAQTGNDKIITGSIINETKLPVSFATLVLKNEKDSSVYERTISDSAGEFRLVAVKEGIYFLEITAVGYDNIVKQNILVGVQDTLIKIGILSLRRPVKFLSGITVQATRPFIERTIDKTVVNISNSITSQGATVLEAMKKLPGVQVTAEGQVTMNGRQGVNIYIDGKPSYLSGEDLASLLGSLPVSTIQKIELISNPSSKYDAAGTAGIINIVKKKNRKEGLYGTINETAGYGHYGRYNTGLTLSYKTRRYNFYLNNTYSYNKGFSRRFVTSDISGINNKLITEQVSSNTGTGLGKYYRLTTGIDFYPSERTTVSISGSPGIGLSDNRLLSLMDIADSNRKKTNRSALSSVLRDRPFNYTVSASLVKQLDTSGKAFSVDLDYATYNNKPRQLDLNTLNDAGGNFISETDALQLQRRQLNIYSIKADVVLPLKNKQRLETGIKSSYVKAANDNNFYRVTGVVNTMDSAYSNYSINSENINAVYINWNNSYKKLIVQAGLRAEQTFARGKQLLTVESVHQDYLQLFPSLFLDYKLSEIHSFNIRLGRRIERAAYNELVPFRRPQTATLFFQGNPDLLPQTAWHGEFSWNYQNALTLTLNDDMYRDYIRTLPFSDSNKITITRKPINIKRAQSWDVDLVYSKKITRWWQSDNTISFYQNSFAGQINGFSLNNPGLLSAYLVISNSFQISHKLSAEINFEYDSKRQYVTSTFGAYSILSSGIKKQVLRGNGSVSLNVNNILQSENHDAIDRTSGLYQYAYLYFYSRYASINFSYRFGKGKNLKAHISSGAEDEEKRAGQ